MRLALVVCLGLCGVAAADPIIGDHAPLLGLPALDGTTVEVPPRVTIVDFFATWCEPCHLAMERLAELSRADGARLDLVIVDVAEPAETVRAYFAAHPPPAGARVTLDADGAASTRWGRHRFPTTFVIDAGGVIRYINRGYGPGYGARIAARVRALLVAPAP